MNRFLWISVALLVAWVALRLVLGGDADAAHLAGVVGVVFLGLGLRRRAHRVVQVAAATPAAGDHASPTGPTDGAVDIGLRRRRRHG